MPQRTHAILVLAALCLALAGCQKKLAKVGGSITAILPVGANLVTASVTDSGGLTTTKSVTVTVTVPLVTDPTGAEPAPTTDAPVLAASAYKVRKNLRVDLTWSGFNSSTIDVFRNGTKVTSTTNDGFWSDSIRRTGTYRYEACAAGTSDCSNEVTVTY